MLSVRNLRFFEVCWSVFYRNLVIRLLLLGSPWVELILSCAVGSGHIGSATLHNKWLVRRRRNHQPGRIFERLLLRRFQRERWLVPVSRSFVNRVLVFLSCHSAPEATVMILSQVKLRGVRSEESRCAGDRQLSVLVVESRFLTTKGSIFVGVA